MTIQDELRIIFRNGERVTNKRLKKTLQYLYNQHEIKSKAKATDIRLFSFTAKRVVIKEDGKKIEGMEICYANSNLNSSL